VRKLPGTKEATYGLRRLWFLSRKENHRFGKEDGEETEEGKSKEGRRRQELVYKVKSYKVCKVGGIDSLLTL